MDGPRILEATPELYADFARLYPELGVDDPVPAQADWLRRMAADTLFLERGGRVVAYGYAQALGDSGYVRHVVVAPVARGTGLGRATMLALRDRLRERGCSAWQLNVKVDNRPAIALYRSLGLAGDYRTWVLRIPNGAPLSLAASPPGLTAQEPLPAADSALEREFDVPAGLLARHRAKADARLFRFELAGRAVALAPFDPFFPGCFPFRLREAACARGVFDTLLPLVPRGRPHLQLVLERDEPAARVLLAAGARLVFEIQHMRGALPGDPAIALTPTDRR